MAYTAKVWKDNIDEYTPIDASSLNKIESTLKTCVDSIETLREQVKPKIGQLYISYTSTSPASIFGGSYIQITDMFLRAANNVTTGGSDTKTIEVDNLPAHSHGMNNHTHSVGAHSHGLNNHTHTVPAHSHGLNNHTHNFDHKHNMYFPLKLVGSELPGYGLDYSAAFKDRVVIQGNTSNVSETALLSPPTYSSNVVMTVPNTGGPSTSNTSDSSQLTSGQASGTTANSSSFNTGASTASTTSVGSGTALNIMPKYQNVYVWRRVS